MSEINGKFSTKIRLRLRKRFFAEAHQTVLINDLLEEHYAKEDK